MIVIERFQRYSDRDYYNLEDYNRLAGRLQKEVGVNPDDCLQIVECSVVNELGITPMEVFVEHLSRKQFPTPPPSLSEHRKHDEFFHFGGVVATHPQTADFYATLSQKALNNELRGGVKWLSDCLDGALGTGVYWVFNHMHGNPPKPDEDVKWGDLTFEAAHRQQIKATEDSHQLKFWAAAAAHAEATWHSRYGY